MKDAPIKLRTEEYDTQHGAKVTKRWTMSSQRMHQRSPVIKEEYVYVQETRSKGKEIYLQSYEGCTNQVQSQSGGLFIKNMVPKGIFAVIMKGARTKSLKEEFA